MRNAANSSSLQDAWRGCTKSGLRSLRLIAMSVCLLPALHNVSGAETGKMPIKVAMTASHWTTEGGVEFGQHKGFDSIELKPGNSALKLKTGSAVLKDLVFRNGTIEYDVDATSSMGAGIGFRRRDNDTFEWFYLRPRPNCEEAWDCMQYAPQTHGILLWDLFPQYQAPAPLRQGEWNHIKLVVSGQRMNIYVNGAQSPTLRIGRLEGDAQEGGIVLEGPGIFANLTVTPDAVEGLSPEPDGDPTATDPRYVRNWWLSPYSELAADKEVGFTDMPAASAAWQALTAERGGLMNLSRVYGLPLPRPQKAIAWLKTTITSDKSQTKKVEIGWTREMWVFVNGKLVYADKNLYQPPAARKTPDGRASLENGSFNLPINAGENEIAVALDTNFYGLSLIFRFDDLDGIHLARK